MLDLLDFRNQSEAKKSMREQSLVGTQQEYPKRENLAENFTKLATVPISQSEAKKSMREQSLVGTQQEYPKRENLAENFTKLPTVPIEI